MARLFRFVEKKRGQRRTGSNLVGSLGEAIIYGSLFLLGATLLSALLINQLLQPDPESFALGLGRWLVIMMLSSFIVVGGGGLIWTVLRVGTSVERRSAMARQAADIDLVNQTVPRPRNYPTLPPFDGLTNSPGIELAYRLPAAQTPGWRLLAAAVFTLLWNFVGCVLTVSAISGHITGRHEWLLSILLVPFWYVSLWSIRYLLQLIVLQTGMGQTTVEVSDLPLVPGRDYHVAIAQDGNVKMKSLKLWLVCEEEATYTQGTDIRTEFREVFRQPCFERQDFRIEPGVPFQETCMVTVPLAAMHSFHSPHNAIRWQLVVHGEAEGWPSFSRGFPIVVYPGEATTQVGAGGRIARQQISATPAVAGVRA
jgi:hypothetical protein